MFTLIMMVLSSLVTLYFAHPGFKKVVKYFFSMTEKKTGLAESTNELPMSKEYVDEQIPTLDQSAARGRVGALGWKNWTKKDAAEHAGVDWTEQDEEDDGQRSR